MIADGPEALAQGTGGAGGDDGADAPLGAAGRIDGEPHAVVGEPAAEGAHRHSRVHGGDQVGGTHAHDAIEAAGAHREVGGGVGREPGALALDARAPVAAVRQGKEPRHRLGGVGNDAGKPGRVALDAGGADDLAKPSQHAVSHGPPPPANRVAACHFRAPLERRTIPCRHGSGPPCRGWRARRDRRRGGWPAWRRASRRRR